MKGIPYLIVLNLFLITYPINNTSAETISVNKNSYETLSRFQYFVDTSEKLTFSEILNSPKFLSSSEKDNLSLSSRVYWLKFSILNTSNSDTEYELNFDQWHKVVFYYKEPGAKTFHIKKTGHLEPYLKRDYPLINRNLIVLNIKRNEMLECYARISVTDDFHILPKGISLTIGTLSEYLKRGLTDMYIRGTFQGIFLILFIYNFFIWMSIKEKTYIYYLGILMLGVHGMLHNTGLTFYFFKDIENFPFMFSRIDMLGAASLIIFYWLFMSSFLHFKERLPFIYKATPYLIIFYSLFPILTLFIPALMVFKIMVPFIILFSVVLFFILALAYKRKIPSAGYFFWANLVPVLAAIVFHLYVSNVLPENPFLPFSLMIGLVVQHVLFSLAFANNVNVLKKENEQKQNAIIDHLKKNEEYLRITQELQLNSEKLKQEIITTEYESLKSQVNPHFLFNSLNVLTGLVYKNQTRAADFIKKLSEVYRYVLENKSKEIVNLNTEIEFINSYIYLLKIRFGNNLKVHFRILEKNSFMIAPLSLQLLVENAIKHNIISSENPLEICFSIEDDYIVVSNNILKKQSLTNSTGIGLKNIISRYGYLTDKEIIIENDSQKFVVKIPLIMLEASEKYNAEEYL